MHTRAPGRLPHLLAAAAVALTVFCAAPDQPAALAAPGSPALTPPLGWNSWNSFGCGVNETVVRQAADAMVSSGMRDAGYQYVVVDDCWFDPQRDTAGNLRAHPTKFPSGMRALGDYIHGRGLKFGIYQVPTERTCAQRNDGGGWWLLGDSFSPVNADYYMWSSSSITANAWTVMNQRDYTPPLNAKHGSITGITDAEYNALIARWGTPSWVRLKSSNFPDRYVLHANRIGRIDPYPFDPYQDQMWRMVPGLADPAGVSFQSVNIPNNYLRHFNFAIRLDPNDNTAIFRADATFHRTAGLADPAWTSLRSHNFPTHHLRHANNLLRIDPISATSSAQDRQDATYRITP